MEKKLVRPFQVFEPSVFENRLKQISLGYRDIK
jgi:hypothetical protein